jgi:hypothetical protein
MGRVKKKNADEVEEEEKRREGGEEEKERRKGKIGREDRVNTATRQLRSRLFLLEGAIQPPPFLFPFRSFLICRSVDPSDSHWLIHRKERRLRHVVWGRCIKIKDLPW